MSTTEILPGEAVDEFEILFAGYVPPSFPTPWGTTSAVAPTVCFVRHGDRKIIYDPGTVPSADSILEPLNKLGYEAGDITDVIVSHHHPDHCRNVGLFQNAKLQDLWGTYGAPGASEGDQWSLRDTKDQGWEMTPGIRLLHTPGHTESDIATLVATPKGLVVFTHLWWTDTVPGDEDPVALFPKEFHDNRERILAIDPALIIPGHGPAFVPNERLAR